jgi:hypothetical protein
MDPDTDPNTDPDSLKMLYPDPDSMNPNPQHCLEVKYCKKKSQIIFLSEHLAQQEKQSSLIFCKAFAKQNTSLQLSSN